MELAGGSQKVIDLAVPQSVILFGLPGLRRKDRDFVPAVVMNHRNDWSAVGPVGHWQASILLAPVAAGRTALAARTKSPVTTRAAMSGACA